MGLHGVGFWLPTLTRQAGIADALIIGLLTVIPHATAAARMALCGRMADAARERRWHIVIPGLLGTIGFPVSISFAKDVVLAEIMLTLASTGVLVILA